MTANASSSSAENPADRKRPDGVDLRDAGLLPPIPAALLAGGAGGILEPVRFLTPGDTPAPVVSAIDRGPLAAGLAEANAAYAHPRAEELAARLADPRTAVVVTGQQPGLFGGPLYTLTKAVAAARWAERLTQGGDPAVAVFWMATEDHDWRESSWALFETPRGPLRVDLGDDPSPLTPLGLRTLGSGVEAALATLGEALPGDHAEAWLSRLAHWYRPSARFGEAFARLLVALLGDRSPLVLDATLPAVKEAEKPWLERLVSDRAAVDAAFAARDRRIDDLGFDLQVAPQPGLAPLFLLRGAQRRRIAWEGDAAWSLRGAQAPPEPVETLLETLRENPVVVSPGVLARPAVQDAILGTTLQVLGAGEVAYLPQVAPLYDLLGIAAPTIALRPQALVLEEHRLRKLAELPLTVGDLIAPDLDLDERLAGSQPDEIVAPTRAEIETALAGLRQRAVEIDPSLSDSWEKTRGQIDKALGAFTGKLTGAVSRTHDVTRQRAEDLRLACRPDGSLQERALCAAHFPSRHGDRFVEALFAQLDLDPRRLQVIVP